MAEESQLPSPPGEGPRAGGLQGEARGRTALRLPSRPVCCPHDGGSRREAEAGRADSHDPGEPHKPRAPRAVAGLKVGIT